MLNTTFTHTPSVSILGTVDEYNGSNIHLPERAVQSASETQLNQSLLFLHIGGYDLFVSLSEINALLSPTPMTTLPLAKPWIIGLTVARSEVITVFDIAYCLDRLLTHHILSQWQLITVPKNKTSHIINKQDIKYVLLANTVASQLAFFTDKVSSTVIPNTIGYKQLKQTTILPESNFIKHIWQHSEHNYAIEVSLNNLLQSQAFNQLTY
jgi:chemotaxis signal transduction protein